MANEDKRNPARKTLYKTNDDPNLKPRYAGRSDHSPSGTRGTRPAIQPRPIDVSGRLPLDLSPPEKASSARAPQKRPEFKPERGDLKPIYTRADERPPQPRPEVDLGRDFVDRLRQQRLEDIKTKFGGGDAPKVKEEYFKSRARGVAKDGFDKAKDTDKGITR